MSDEARVTPDVGLSRRAPGAHPPTQLDPRVGIAKGAAKAFKLPSLDSLTRYPQRSPGPNYLS